MLELDAHSLYGTMMSMATATCDLFHPSRENLLVSRSTFAGSGKFAGRWLGENKSTYEYMR